MANTSIQLKKSGATGNTPDTLNYGELALNYADGKLYYKNSIGNIDYISKTNSYSTVNVGGNLLVASSPSDLLNISAGDNVVIASNTLTNSITISSTGGGTGGGSGNSIYINNTTINRQTYTASSAQTIFGIAYTDQVLVYINGVNIDPSEFTAPDGNYVFLKTGAAQYDIIDLIGFSNSGNTITTSLNISNTTPSTSSTTGAVTIGGGLGVSSNVHIGGSLFLDNNYQSITFNNSSISTKNVTVNTTLQVIDSFDITNYKSATYQVQAQNGDDFHTFNLNVAHNGTTVYYTIFGELFSSAKLVTIDSSISSGSLNIYCTPQVASVNLSFVRSLIQK